MERQRSLSLKRGTSKGGTSAKDRSEPGEKVNITKVNKDLETTPPRPVTAEARGRQPAAPEAANASRPGTAGISKERQGLEKRARREQAQ